MGCTAIKGRKEADSFGRDKKVGIGGHQDCKEAGRVVRWDVRPSRGRKEAGSDGGTRRREEWLVGAHHGGCKVAKREGWHKLLGGTWGRREGKGGRRGLSGWKAEGPRRAVWPGETEVLAG